MLARCQLNIAISCVHLGLTVVIKRICYVMLCYAPCPSVCLLQVGATRPDRSSCFGTEVFFDLYCTLHCSFNLGNWWNSKTAGNFVGNFVPNCGLGNQNLPRRVDRCKCCLFSSTVASISHWASIRLVFVYSAIVVKQRVVRVRLR